MLYKCHIYGKNVKIKNIYYELNLEHSFCYSYSINSNRVEKLKIELLINFLKFFKSLMRCIKAKATFKIKENVTPIFRLKRKVPFAAEASISKELDCLEQIGVLTKMD